MKCLLKTYSVLFIILFVVFTSFTNDKNSAVNRIHLGGWSKLGTQAVSEGVVFDELVLSEEKKNVKRLKIKALKTSVYMSSIKILYKDGTSENHIISRRLEKGDSSRAFDLIGHYRTIEKILFIYRGDSGKGGAQILVFGKF